MSTLLTYRHSEGEQPAFCLFFSYVKSNFTCAVASVILRLFSRTMCSHFLDTALTISEHCFGVE